MNENTMILLFVGLFAILFIGLMIFEMYKFYKRREIIIRINNFTENIKKKKYGKDDVLRIFIADEDYEELSEEEKNKKWEPNNTKIKIVKKRIK